MQNRNQKHEKTHHRNDTTLAHFQVEAFPPLTHLVSLWSYSIQLINEDDHRGVLLGFFKG